MSRRSPLPVCLAAVVLAAGCGGPSWTVVVQAVPDPFAGGARFIVAPIDYTGLYVGKKFEADYLAEKDDEKRKGFMEDKASINEAFAAALIQDGRDHGLKVDPATGPQDGSFVIRPFVKFIEPGFYAAVVSEASRVEMDVKITTPDGRVLDEIVIAHGTDASFDVPASRTRLRGDGLELGLIVAKYIATRARVP